MAKKDIELKSELIGLWLDKIMSTVKTEYGENADEDVLQVASGSFALPVLDEEQNERWVKVTISIPSGERGGDGYDGYEEHEEYMFKVESARLKAEEKKKKEEKRKAKQKKTE